jgi:autotransporter-associated beta strand protein
VVATANALNLVVTGSAADLTWSGAQNQWDIGATSSWMNGTVNDVFHDGDAVAFTDSAANGAVTIGATVTPRSVIVNNTTRAFSMTGTAVTGEGDLRKSGTGTLTLNASNTFGGGTVLNDGAIQLGNATANATALGSGTVTMNGGILRMYSAGTGTHAGTLPNALHVSGNARFEVAPRCGFSGGVSGNGTLDYRTNYVRADVTGDWSQFTGQVDVTTTGSGDFRIASSYGWPGLPNATVNLAAGTYFYMSGIVNNGQGTIIAIGALAGENGSHLRGGPTAARTVTYRIGGKGSDTTYSGDIAEQSSGTTTVIVKTGAGVWALGGPATHRGSTTVEAGTLRLLAGGSITSAAAISVRSGAVFCLDGGSTSVESINIAEGATFTSIGGNISGEFNNSGIATVTSGTLTLSGNITNSGTLRVTSGAQLVTNGRFVNSGILDLLTSASSLPANLINTGIIIENTDRRVLAAARSGTNFSVTLIGHSGHSYQLQRTGNLGGPWTNIGSAVAGGGGTLVLTDPGALGSRLFYRVAIVP